MVLAVAVAAALVERAVAGLVVGLAPTEEVSLGPRVDRNSLLAKARPGARQFPETQRSLPAMSQPAEGPEWSPTAGLQTVADR